MAEELIKLGGYVVQGHGFDETVLWEGNVQSGSITLTESPSKFEYLKVIVADSAGWGSDAKNHPTATLSTARVLFDAGYFFYESTNTWHRYVQISAANTNDTVWTVEQFAIKNNVKQDSSTNLRLIKVVGIGRKPVEG